MFLSNDYILANELTKKMNIHIANISMLKQRLEDQNNETDMVKLNNCTFINKKSIFLPKNIREGIKKNIFTDISNKLPVTFVKSEYEITEREMNNSGIIQGKKKIAGKDFYVFNNDFVEKVKNSIVYVLDKKETEECSKNGDINGFVKLSKNKFLTWYYI